MKKYIIYRIADEDIENYNQHELVGVEYGEDIDDAMDRLIEAICEDLSENPKYARCTVCAYPPEDELNDSDRYQYQMDGVVSPPVAEENIVVPYGIIEQESDQ